MDDEVICYEKVLMTMALTLFILLCMIMAVTVTASAAVATNMWVEADTNPIPADIEVFNSSGNNYQLYIPGGIETTSLHFTWDGDVNATVDSTSYPNNNTCPIQYAVEKVKDGKKIIKKVTKRKTVTKKVPGNPVNTGDTTNLLPMVGLFAAAVVLLLLAVWNHRRNRKDGEEA